MAVRRNIVHESKVGIQGLPGLGFTHKGTWVNGTSYVVNDVVTYNGSSYSNIVPTTSALPTDNTHWNLFVSKGDKGDAGTGLTAIVQDTAPQLGGNLDLNTHVITGMVIGTNIQAHSAVLDATTASYTTAEQTKLAGIAAGAQVNTVASVDGQTGAVSLAANYDALGAASTAVSNHVAAIDPHGDRAYAAGLVAGVTPTSLGLVIGTNVQAHSSVLDATTASYTTAKDTKLTGIETGAQVNTVASVNTKTGSVVINPDDLVDTTTIHKFTTAADISKLAGIQAGAQVNTVSSVNSKTGAVSLTYTDVGADPTGTASTAVSNHIAATDPHGDRAFTTSSINTHIAASDPHGDRAYAATLVDDLSGITDGATARVNLSAGASLIGGTGSLSYTTSGPLRIGIGATANGDNITATTSAPSMTGNNAIPNQVTPNLTPGIFVKADYGTTNVDTALNRGQIWNVASYLENYGTMASVAIAGFGKGTHVFGGNFVAYAAGTNATWNAIGIEVDYGRLDSTGGLGASVAGKAYGVVINATGPNVVQGAHIQMGSNTAGIGPPQGIRFNGADCVASTGTLILASSTSTARGVDFHLASFTDAPIVLGTGQASWFNTGGTSYIYENAGIMTYVASTSHSFTKEAAFADGIFVADGKVIRAGTTTGMQIGGATNQKIGVFGATPIVRPAGWSASSGTPTRTGLTTSSTINDIINWATALQADLTSLGWIGA